MKLNLLVLAAGIGSRYGGLKQLDGVGPSGEAIIDYSIYDAIRAGFSRVVFIIRKDIEADFRLFFLTKLEPFVEVDYVFQEMDMIPAGFTVPEGRTKPWGTGHAILVAEKKIDTPFVVINGDDYYGPESYRLMAAHLRNESSVDPLCWAMIGYDLERTLSAHGTVARGICETENDFLTSIREITNIGWNKGKIGYRDEKDRIVELPGDTPVSMNIWGFTPAIFGHLSNAFNHFLKHASRDPKSEFYIPSVINELVSKQLAHVRVLRGAGEWFGVTYREDRDSVIHRLAHLVREGAYPVRLWEK
jgi:UTP-glucose-1-phosphate uridylyltransferase